MKHFFQGIFARLSQYDLYSQKVNLLIKQQESYSTLLGIISSILIGSFTFFSFLSLTIQMLERSNPNIVDKTIQNLNPEAFYLDPDEFLFAFGLSDPKSYPIVNTINETYYTITLEFCQLSIVQNGSSSTSLRICHSIDMVNCPRAGLNPKLTEGLSEQRLSWAMCPNRTTWNRLKNETFIQGVTTSPEFRFISANAYKCDPTIRSDCASAEKLEKLSVGFMQMAFTERLLDQGKPGDPFQYISNTNYYTYSNTSSTNIIYKLRHSFFRDEINYFYYFPSIDNYHVLILEDTTISYVNSPGQIMHLSFVLSSKTEIFSRTYNNFFDILGNVSGIQGFLTFIISLVAVPYTKRAQQISLLNSIFQFKKGEAELVDEMILSNNQLGFSKKPIKQSFNQIKTFESSLKRYLTQKHKKLKFTFLEKITMGCIGNNQSLIRKGQSKIENQLEITTILNKLNELEKLKHFLLNDHQLKLFEYIPKPVISLNKKNQVRQLSVTSGQLEYFAGNTKFDVKVEKALNSYKLLKSSRREDDQKLISMLDNDIKGAFDSIVDRSEINNHPNDSKKDLDRNAYFQRSKVQETFDEIEELQLNNQNRFLNI